MTSMRRRYVASTSLRRHVPAGNLPPPPNILNLAPQYSKPYSAYEDRHVFSGSNAVIFFLPCSQYDSTLKEKNLLLQEQILSVKSRAHYGRAVSSRDANEVTNVAPLSKMAKIEVYYRQ